MTPERLSEIRACCEKATPGPWYQDCQPPGPCAAKIYSESVFANGMDTGPVICLRSMAIGIKGRDGFYNMVFIALSRTAIPELLAEVERLQAEVALLNQQLHAGKINDADYIE